MKWFSARKHYGFITTGQDDVFFHQQQLLEDVDEAPEKGQSVRFHRRPSPKGPEALNVEVDG